MTAPDVPEPVLIADYERHWKGMTLRDQLNEWRERALLAEAEVAQLKPLVGIWKGTADRLAVEVERWQKDALDAIRALGAEAPTPQDVTEGHDGTHGPCRICGVEP